MGSYDSGDASGGESMSEVDARILSGAYSDTGSTKDRLSRPLRRALVKDQIGPGTQSCHVYKVSQHPAHESPGSPLSVRPLRSCTCPSSLRKEQYVDGLCFEVLVGSKGGSGGVKGRPAAHRGAATQNVGLPASTRSNNNLVGASNCCHGNQAYGAWQRSRNSTEQDWCGTLRAGRKLAGWLARLARQWRADAAERMPEVKLCLLKISL